MERINTASKAVDLFGAGKHGFKNGNLGAGVEPTDLNAEWFNGVQEELLSVIEAGGQVPDGGALNQLLLALRAAGVFQTAPALDSSTKAATTSFVQANAYAHGQCRFAKSGANVVLSPYNGNRLIVNGRICRIPSAGVSLAPAGLVAGALYYVYARDANNDGVVETLEASATGHSPDANTGVECMNGDATRTLVGMVRPIAGPAFADTATQRFVLSWFNRRTLSLLQPSAAVAGIGSVESDRTAANRCEFLCWTGDVVAVGSQGQVTDTTVQPVLFSSVGIDGARVSHECGVNILNQNSAFTMSVRWSGSLAEGYHHSTYVARVSTGNTGAATVQNWAECQG